MARPAHPAPVLRPAARAVVEAMEPRLLYSADAASVALAAAGAGELAGLEERRQLEAAQATSNQALTEIVFIDASVTDADKLVADLQAQQAAGRAVEIVRIAADQDGIALIGQTLQGRSDIGTVHLVSHGADGTVHLGDTVLDQTALFQRAGEIAAWSQALGPDADLLIYGCGVAASDEGKAFVQDLAALTGADVAASSDATGATVAGGDWDLEVRTGAIEAALAPSVDLQAAWTGVLPSGQGYAIWLSPDSDGGGSWSNLTPIDDEELLQLGGTNLNYGTTTTGSFSRVGFDLRNFGLNNVSLDDVVYVEKSLTLASGVTVQAGDLLFTLGSSATLTSGSSSLAVNSDDVVRFRPTTAGNYGAGTFTMAMENMGLAVYGSNSTDITGLALVQNDLSVGEASLTAGTLLFSVKGGSQDSDIFYVRSVTLLGLIPIGYDAPTLVKGSEVGIEKRINALEIASSDVTLANYVAPTGRLLVSLDGNDTVGANNLSVKAEDVFAMRVDQTSLSGTASAQVQLLIQGADLSMNGQNVDAIALLPQGAYPVITGGTAVSSSVAENATAVRTIVATDADAGATITYSIVGGTDASSFSIDASTGALRFVTAPDYENPGDSNTNNIYVVNVRASDGTLFNDQQVTVTVTNANDAPTLDHNTGATVAEGASVTITSTMLHVSDQDQAASARTYTLSTLAGHGKVRLNGSDLALNATFTQADIDAGKLSYLHDGSETPAADSFGFTVSDGAGGSLSATSFALTITAVNDAPVIATNAGTSVGEGTSKTLTTAMLSATDADNTAAQLRYTLVALPAHGALKLSGSALAAGGSFTQDDLANGRVAYLHDGSETSSDGFTFSLSDGAGATLADASFALTITPADDAPLLATGATGALAYTENDGPVVAAPGLTLSDADTPSFGAATVTISTNYQSGQDRLGFTADHGITGSWDSGTGVLSLSGSATAAQWQDVLRSVSYENLGELPSTAARTVRFEISDGTTAVTADRSIGVASINDAPSLAGPGGPYAATEQTWLSLIGGWSAGDVDAASGILKLTLSVDSGIVRVVAGSTGVSVSGNETATVEVTGQLSQLNAMLAGSGGAAFAYKNDSDTPPPQATLGLLLSDQGHGGSGGALTASGSATIVITAVNDLPVLAASTGATLAEDGSLVITDSMLKLTDADDAADHRRYTIGGLPAHGALLLSGTALRAGDSFTQADIDAGRLSYHHDGSETTADAIGFSYADDSGAVPVTGQQFDMTITPVNDLPVFATSSLVIGQGGLARPDITVIDADDAPSLVRISASGISGGQFEYAAAPNVAITEFTLAELQAGDVLFRQDGSSTAPTASLLARDQAAAAGNATLAVDFIVALPPPVQQQVPDGPVQTTQPAQPTQSPVTESSTPAAESTASAGSVAADAVLHVTQGLSALPARDETAVGWTAAPPELQFGGVQVTAGGSVTGIALNDRNPTAATADLQDLSLDVGSLRTSESTQQASVNRLDDEMQQLRRQLLNESDIHNQVFAGGIALSSGLSVGYVIWLVRGGALLGSMLSSMPAWQMMDPLPVLARAGRAGTAAGPAEGDGEVENLFDDRAGAPAASPEPRDVRERAAAEEHA